jgi:hypothetical protein
MEFCFIFLGYDLKHIEEDVTVKDKHCVMNASGVVHRDYDQIGAPQLKCKVGNRHLDAVFDLGM